MDARVSIPLSSFKAQLKVFGRMPKRNQVGDARLYEVNGNLHISSVGIDLCWPVEGEWPGDVRLDVRYLCGISRLPTLQDPVVLEVHGNRLKVDSLTFPCRWEPHIPAASDLPLRAAPLSSFIPMNAPFALLVALSLDLTPEEKDAGGVTEILHRAATEKERLIQHASSTLHPLGITPEDVRAMVHSKLHGTSRKYV